MKKIDIVNIIRNGGATLSADGVAVNFKNGYQVSKKAFLIGACQGASALKVKQIKE